MENLVMLKKQELRIKNQGCEFYIDCFGFFPLSSKRTHGFQPFRQPRNDKKCVSTINKTIWKSYLKLK